MISVKHRRKYSRASHVRESQSVSLGNMKWFHDVCADSRESVDSYKHASYTWSSD